MINLFRCPRTNNNTHAHSHTHTHTHLFSPFLKLFLIGFSSMRLEPATVKRSLGCSHSTDTSSSTSSSPPSSDFWSPSLKSSTCWWVYNFNAVFGIQCSEWETWHWRQDCFHLTNTKFMIDSFFVQPYLSVFVPCVPDRDSLAFHLPTLNYPPAAPAPRALLGVFFRS